MSIIHRLDYDSTLFFAASLTLLFTLAVALLWEYLHKEPAYRRLLLWNVLVFASQVLRLNQGDRAVPIFFAAYWSFLLGASMVYCSAALVMINRQRYERYLFTCCALVLAVVWGLALLTSREQLMGVIVGTVSSGLYIAAAVAVYQLIHMRNALVRIVVAAPFGLVAFLGLWFVWLQLAGMRMSALLTHQRAISHYFGEMVVLCANLTVLLWLFLRQEQRISQLARTDALTGALNRRGLDAALGATSRQHELGGSSATSSIVMMDIDHFKRINDANGHRVGDEVLREFSALVLQHKRAADIFARWGGEEYCVILHDMDAGQAATWAENLRSALKAKPLPSQADMPRQIVTASFGVAELTGLGTGWQHAFNSALQRADQALYEAKSRGRDRVVISDDGQLHRR
jgi:diguanylate cyclase (GGDEF)-like protein